MDFLIGLVSSSVASIASYPADVIKSQYQVAHINHGKNLSGRQLFSNVYKQQGLRGFYRGVGSHLMTYPVFWSVFWELDQHKINFTMNKHMNTGISAFVYGSMATLVANPLFFLKIRKQTEILRNNTNVSYLGLVRQTYRQEGFRAFYKGYPVTALSNIKLGVQFPLYDYLKENTDSVLVSSVGSKVIASSIFYPSDLIRDVQRDSTKKLSIWAVSKQVWTKNGFFGFYRGLGLYNLCTAPNFIIMMVVRDKLKAWLN